MLRVRVKSKPMFKPQLLPYARLTHILGLHDLAFIYIFWHDLLNNLSLFTMKCQFQQIWNYCINVSMSGAGNRGTLAPTLAHWHIDNPHRGQPREQIVLLRQNAEWILTYNIWAGLLQQIIYNFKRAIWHSLCHLCASRAVWICRSTALKGVRETQVPCDK